MDLGLKDCTAFITGGAGTLGFAMAKRFVSEGCQVVVCDVNQEAIDRACQELQDLGGTALGVSADVTNKEQVGAAVQSALARFGKVDVLVNNAGFARDRYLTKMAEEDWHAVLDVTLTGAFHCSRAVLPSMMENRFGRVINIASRAHLGNPGQTNYSAAKAGVVAATVTWAKELARYGIRVAGIAPGFIETEMTLGMKPEALEKMTAGIPLKRMGKVEEIAHSAAYIFENDYYSGRILELDGGLRI